LQFDTVAELKGKTPEPPHLVTMPGQVLVMIGSIIDHTAFELNVWQLIELLS
jgi:hypothetical protein